MADPTRSQPPRSRTANSSAANGGGDSHNENAEKALLGAMLQSAPAVAEAITQLAAADLYRPAHQLIWTAIVDGDHWGDVILTEAELRNRGQLRQAGGATYLIDLMAACPAGGAEHVAHYAALIRDRAQYRARIETATRLHHAATDSDTYATLLHNAQLDTPPPVLTPPTIRVIHADQMTPRAALWLWDQRIPLDAITLLAGAGGIGKSTISYDLAAHVTRGTLPGAHINQPRTVAVAANEEAWEEVILGRLIAAHADLHRVIRLDPIDNQQLRGLILPKDLHALTDLTGHYDIGLLIIDPILGAVDRSLNTHVDAESRVVLEALARFAIANGVTILATIHANKSATGDPLKAIMGSAAFANVARSVLYCLPDPDDDHGDRYLCGHVKSNNGPKQSTLAYRLTTTVIETPDPTTGQDITTSRVVWQGDDPTGRAIEDLLNVPRERREGKLATDLLAFITAQETPPVSTLDIAGAFPKINRATLNRTLARLVDRGKLARPLHGHYKTVQD